MTLEEKIAAIPSGMDAVFLPGKVHGCDWQAYIIYFNENADEGNGCWEIEIVDKERILKLYDEVNGDSEAFFGRLPDMFHGEWYYCNNGSDDFEAYLDAYPTADFICGRDGGDDEEMMFLVNWAKGATVPKARRIEGIVYRVKTTHGGLLVEVPDEGDTMEDLARYCANLSMQGYIISSVTRVFDADTATPRVSVLSSKEYKAEIKRLMKERSNGNRV